MQEPDLDSTSSAPKAPKSASVEIPGDGRPSLPRFGFSGLCLVIGMVTFAIQQGCSVTGTAPSWGWGVVWFVLAMLLVVLSIWFWDRTATHNWRRKSILTVVVIGLMAVFSYIPIAKQYRLEHTATALPKLLTATEIEDIVRRATNGTFPKQPDVMPALGSRSPTRKSQPLAGAAVGRVQVIFKDSPFFKSRERQDRIRSNIGRFYDYLLGIGFDAPADMPPLGTRPGRVSTRAFSDPKIYYQSIEIAEDRIDDPMTIVGAYSDYAFSKLLDDGNRSNPKNAYRGIMAHIFATYFNWSFSDKTWSNPPRTDSLDGALWEIRGKCGKDFTDHALFYTFKTLDDFLDPNLLPTTESYTLSGEQVNKYFVSRFRIGVQVRDIDFRNWFTIQEILKNRGLWSN